MAKRRGIEIDLETCAFCKKPKGDHQAGTLRCPVGRKQRTIGYTQFSDKSTFFPRVAGRRQKFKPFVWVRADIGLVELVLEDVSHYGEWIRGEGADICVYRANDNDRLVGVNLPWRKGMKKLRTFNDLTVELGQAADAARVRVSEMSKKDRAQLQQRARDLANPIPPWQKPPRDIPVQALREFLARFGPDVSVLVTWSHDSPHGYQFLTIGADSLYAHAAVRLRDEIADCIEATPLGPTTEDLRHHHPNLKLNMDQLDFVLWMLGRTFAEKDKLDEAHQNYIGKFHDQVLPIFGNAKERLAR